MRMLDLAGHLAFALIALSFLVRDILWLRALSIAASLASISYSYYAPARPLWLVIGWNIVFIALNLTQITLLLRERRGVSFTDQERELYQTSFARFTPVEFTRLIRIAAWKDAAAGTKLIDAGEGRRWFRGGPCRCHSERSEESGGRPVAQRRRERPRDDRLRWRQIGPSPPAQIPRYRSG